MDTSVNILTYILEDDVEIHDVIKTVLKSHNITDFHIYDDPVEFLENLNPYINICVIDHKLRAGLTGIEVIKAVKEKNKRSYVVVMTGQNDYQVVVQYLNLKADCYIDKNEIDSNRKMVYLDRLVDAILVGLKEAEKRVEFVKYLEEQKS